MKSKHIMVSSSIVMGVFGVVMTFFPQEAMYKSGLPVQEPSLLFVQMLGAMTLGFSVLNWMTKDFIIGGIYARPISLSNLIHFTVSAIALLKSIPYQSETRIVWLAAGVYSVFALLFGILIFTRDATSRASVK